MCSGASGGLWISCHVHLRAPRKVARGCGIQRPEACVPGWQRNDQLNCIHIVTCCCHKLASSSKVAGGLQHLRIPISFATLEHIRKTDPDMQDSQAKQHKQPSNEHCAEDADLVVVYSTTNIQVGLGDAAGCCNMLAASTMRVHACKACAVMRLLQEDKGQASQHDALGTPTSIPSRLC